MHSSTSVLPSTNDAAKFGLTSSQARDSGKLATCKNPKQMASSDTPEVPLENLSERAWIEAFGL